MGTRGRGTPRRSGMSSVARIGADPEERPVDFRNVEVDPGAGFDGEDILTAGESCWNGRAHGG